MRIIRKRSQRYALGNSMLVQESLLLFINAIPKAFSLNKAGIAASRCGDGVLNLFIRFAWLLFFLFWAFSSTNALAQTALVNDGVVSGSISAPGELDEFTFVASIGDAVHIRAAYTSGTHNIEAWLYNPDGTLVRHHSDYDTAEFDCYASSSSCQLNQTGTYRLVVADVGSDAAGSYDVHFAKVPESKENNALINDGVVSGDLTLGDIDTFIFEASIGDAVHIRAAYTSGTHNIEAWLYNPDGTLVRHHSDYDTAEFDCYASSSSCQLNQTGTYRLVVADVGSDAAGSYAINFVGPPQQTGTPPPQIDTSSNKPTPSITTTDSSKIAISMDSGNEEGTNSDWWLVANTPFGLFSYDLGTGSWAPGINATYQDALFSFDLFDFMNISDLPGGTFTLYFGVDTLMNGKLDLEQAIYDSVEVDVCMAAETFVWPVDDHNKISNSYDTHNLLGNDKYHSGFDLTSSTGSKIVRAAACGVVRNIPTGTIGSDDDNHDLGNVIIIDHNNGEGPFTLYAHLEGFSVENGATVFAGEEIGKMGNTGCSNDTPSCGIHLHFEVKQWNVLGNLDDDKGPFWGYIPVTPPNLYGYINPWPYFDDTIVQLDQVTAVFPTANQIVRTGPGTDYKKSLGEVDENDMFVAFSRYENWYQIYLPSIFGPATGWIQAQPEPNVIIRRINDPVRGTTGVNVCPTETACAKTFNRLSYLWDHQWFVEIEQAPAQGGCNSPWIKTFLGKDASQRTGWVCGDYVDLN